MKKETTKEINQIISKNDLDLYQTIEVLANVFISQGSTYLEFNSPPSNKIDLLKIVLDDVKKNGETLPNSMVKQGLLILSWLESEENV